MKTRWTEFEVRKAGEALGHRMMRKAARTARDIGFSYEPVTQAPVTMQGLLAAFQHSQEAAAPLPVWEGGSDRTIYGLAEANYAFRYLHDLVHCITGYGMETDGELRVHTRLAKVLGVEVYTPVMGLEDRLYWIDTAGQTYLAEYTGGKFTDDQFQFALDVLAAWTPDKLLATAVREVCA